MKCNYNGCSSKCKGDINVESCNVLRAYNQGAREFAEWCLKYNIDFSNCKDSDCDKCTRTICRNTKTYVDVALAEWQKEQLEEQGK